LARKGEQPRAALPNSLVLEHDPEKHALGLDPGVGAGFPSGQTRRVCRKIMLKEMRRGGFEWRIRGGFTI
jgi:hypothetical protein